MLAPAFKFRVLLVAERLVEMAVEPELTKIPPAAQLVVLPTYSPEPILTVLSATELPVPSLPAAAESATPGPG